MPFIELDREIERAAGASLAELFLLYGLPAYRRHERRALEALLLRDEAMVIATGGSIVSEPETFDLLLSTCRVVWLKAKPEEHMARVVAQGDQRPMAGSTEAMEDLKRILAGRELLYRKADAIVDTSGKTIAQSLKLLRSTAAGETCRVAKRAGLTAMVTFDTASRPLRALAACASTARSRRWSSTSTRTAASSPGYKLKLNSYDLGVDIELADALQRLRFEHPEVRCLVITSGKERMFCSGANIYMLGASSHAWKVNFCKFTNETRNGIEDASRYSGLKSIAALNGTTAGGGYELALACDEILMIDDRSSTVSLPEVPLLAVLPGTGGLTRLTDKRRRAPRSRRRVLHDDRRRARRSRQSLGPGRRDRDAEARSPRRLPAARRTSPRRARIARTMRRRAASCSRRSRATMVEAGINYPNLDVALDRARARRDLHAARAGGCRAPTRSRPSSRSGADWWPLALARELDDAILLLRTNELDIGTWVHANRGRSAASCWRSTRSSPGTRNHWLVRETIGLWRRTLSRLDVSSRSVFALIDRGSCFAGTLLELALAADRSYMLALPDERACRAGDRAVGAEFRRLSDVQRTHAARQPFCGRYAARRSTSARCCTPMRRARPGWSPSRPTTSTGTTKSGWRSKSARACRPTR